MDLQGTVNLLMGGLASPFLTICRDLRTGRGLVHARAIHSCTENFRNYYNLFVSSYEQQQCPDPCNAPPRRTMTGCLWEGRVGSSADNMQLLPSAPAWRGLPAGFKLKAEHNKGLEPHNVEQLVTYSPVLTPSCGAQKSLWKVTSSVCTVMTSLPSVCPSAQRKIIMRLNLTISCIPKNILPALLNKEFYCTLIPLGKGNNHSCEHD